MQMSYETLKLSQSERTLPSWPPQHRPLEKQLWIQRLFGRHPHSNAVIAVQNLLAARELSSVTAADVAREAAAHGANVRKLEAELAWLYRACLEQCLSSEDAAENRSGNGDLAHL